MRAFVALEMPAQLADEAAAVARVLSSRIEGRFIPRENYPLTLAFLGSIEETQVRDAMAVLDEVGRQGGPVALMPSGLGKFGRAHDATFWMGFAPTDSLMNLCVFVRDQLAARSVPFESNAFKPHLTLARRAHIPQGPLSDAPFPAPSEGHTVTLFKSNLARTGATYKPLYSVELSD